MEASPSAKPVLACWLGDTNQAVSHEFFSKARIPEFSTPAQAVHALSYSLRAHGARNRSRSAIGQRRQRCSLLGQSIIDAVLADGRHLLSEIEAKRLLAGFGIPVVPTQFADTPEEAERACAAIRGPYALKIVSPDITHKSDYGGVVLGLADAATVRQAAQGMQKRIGERFPNARMEGFAVQTMIRRKSAHELFAGIASDPAFGPIVLFGAGGTAIEVINDKAIGLPPISHERARELIEETRIARLLSGYRHIPATDRGAVAGVLIALSNVALNLPDVVELDINPLIADADGVIALDARVVLKRHESAQGPLEAEEYL